MVNIPYWPALLKVPGSIPAQALFMSYIPAAGCRSHETLNWRCLVLGVYAKTNKRPHPWGKCEK